MNWIVWPRTRTWRIRLAKAICMCKEAQNKCGWLRGMISSVFLEPRVGAATGGPCLVRPWRAWTALLRNLGACSADLIFHLLRNINESSSLILDTWMFIQTLAYSHLLTKTCIHMYPVRTRYLDFMFPMLDYIVWRQGKGRQKCWILCFSRHVIQHRQRVRTRVTPREESLFHALWRESAEHTSGQIWGPKGTKLTLLMIRFSNYNA